MSVILTSTGVTFPDSTTQTTAAAASPATLLASGNLSGTSVSIDSIINTTTYSAYQVFVKRAIVNTSYSYLSLRFIAGGSVRTSYYNLTFGSNSTSTVDGLNLTLTSSVANADSYGYSMFYIVGGEAANGYAIFNVIYQNVIATPSLASAYWQNQNYGTTTGINLYTSNGNTFTSGTYKVYGYQ